MWLKTDTNTADTDLYSCVVDKATKGGRKKKTGNRAWLLAERWWFNVRQKVRPFAQAGWLAGWLAAAATGLHRTSHNHQSRQLIIKRC